MTLITYFSRDFYISSVLPLFPDDSTRLLQMYKTGSMPGFTEHYSTNAMFLSTGLLYSGAELFNGKRSKYVILKTVLLAVALLLTGKRGHIVFVAMSLFILYYQSQSDKKGINRFTRIIGFLLIAGCVAVIAFNIFPALSIFLIRFQDSIKAGNITTGRVILWGLQINSIKKHPVIGIGWHHFAEDLSWAYNGLREYDGHNVYLQLLCETGAIGFVIYISYFIIGLIHANKLYKCVVNNKENFLQADIDRISFSFGFQIFFLMYGVTGNPLYMSIMSIPYFVCCGITSFYYSRVFIYNSSMMNHFQKIRNLKEY